MLAPEQLRSIIRSAILAPSADNRHHIAFEAFDRGLRIWTDSHYSQCTEPHRRQLTAFSFGAVIENALLQASAYGLGSDVIPFPDPNRPKLVCELQWTKTDAVEDALCVAIDERHTNRKFFKGPPLTEHELTILTQEVERFTGARVHWCDTEENRPLLLSQVWRAEAERFRRPKLHEELFSAIDWSAGWSSSCEEGLPPGALEVEKPMRFGFRAMSAWSVMRALCVLQAHQFLGFRAAYMPCRLAPHLAVLTVPSATPQNTIMAGRAFQRLWLHATLLGCALQPMAASIALALKPVGDGWVSGQACEALQAGWERLVGRSVPQMVFRLGKAKRPAIRTSRKPAETYLMHPAVTVTSP